MSSTRSYDSTRSRDPIWTQVTADPGNGLRSTSHEIVRQLQSASPSQNSSISSLASNRDETSVLIDKSKTGYSFYSAAIFIAGEMAGSGVLALPRAIVNTGYIGILILICLGLCAAYGGFRLGCCWTILEERFPEHRNRTRNPYATIAFRAVGNKTRVFVSNCIRVTLFGASIVYLLLASQIFYELLVDIVPKITPCIWFVILAMSLTLPMWLGSPKDFCFVGLGALLTTAVACTFYFSQMVMDYMNSTQPALHSTHGFEDFFLSFGTLLFAFGGASTFPTIQNDMETKNQFSWSILIGFLIIFALYFPVSVGGYFIYGEDVLPNVAMTISRSPIVTFANSLMAIHLLLAFLIVINPVCQEMEEKFQIPRQFNWRRVVMRTSMVGLMVFIGLLIPQFGKILAFVGGSTVTLLTFVFPTYFYMRLCDQENPHWPERKIPLHERVFIWELIFVGVVGGTASTTSAMRAIFAEGLLNPCFF